MTISPWMAWLLMVDRNIYQVHQNAMVQARMGNNDDFRIWRESVICSVSRHQSLIALKIAHLRSFFSLLFRNSVIRSIRIYATKFFRHHVARSPSLPPYLDGTLLPLFYARSRDDFGIGDIGTMFKAVDLTGHLKQNLIQILSTKRSSYEESPFSVRCSLDEPLYINIPMLQEEIPCAQATAHLASMRDSIAAAWDAEFVDYDLARRIKYPALRMIWEESKTYGESVRIKRSFLTYKEENEHVREHALYVVLQNRFMDDLGYPHGWDWRTWPGGLRDRDPESLRASREEHAEEIDYQIFLQWVFDRQMTRLVEYAKKRGITFMDDLPYGLDWAALWLNPELADLKGPAYKRRFSVWVPPEPANPTGFAWQFSPYNFRSPETLEFYADRVRDRLRHFGFRRLDFNPGLHEYYLVLEDVDDELTLEKLEIWEDVCQAVAEGQLADTDRKWQLAEDVYHSIGRALAKSALLRDLHDEIFEDDDQMKAESAVLVARATEGELTHGWFHIRSVEKDVFKDQLDWQVIWLSPLAENMQQRPSKNSWDMMMNYLFPEDASRGPKSTDGIRVGFSRQVPNAEDFHHQLRDAAHKDGAMLVAEVCGILAKPSIFETLRRAGIMTFADAFEHFKPWEPEVAPFPSGLHYSDFAVFGTHDLPPITVWWDQLRIDQKQSVLDVLYFGQERKAEDFDSLSPSLVRDLLLLVYRSRARVTVLMWPDLLMQGEEGWINDFSNGSSRAHLNWRARMPKEVSLDSMLLSAEGHPSTPRAKQVIDLVRYLKANSHRSKPLSLDHAPRWKGIA